MKKFLLGALACVMCGPAAHAQFAVYGQGQAVRFNDPASGSTTWFKGGTFGVYDDVLRLPVLGVGFDARGTFLSGDNQQHFRSGMVGLRADARAPVLPFRPYVEGLIGVGATKTDGVSNGSYSNKFAYEVLGGLDFTVLPHIDLRLPEIGYGQMGSAASTSSAPNTKLLGLSAGLVIRLF